MRAVLLALCVLLASCSQMENPPGSLPPVDGATGPRSSADHGFTSLYSFTGKPDGEGPSAALTALNGTFYGTTQSGGANDRGAVFAVSTSGKESVLYSFGLPSTLDGTTPTARLTALNGTLYGTTQYGGANCAPAGCGTIFEVSTSGSESVLYSFKGGTDGAHPVAGLIDVGGRLYGATAEGGNGHSCCGTVFAVSAAGAESVVYRFKGGKKDGAEPLGDLIRLHGEFYGTTKYGGAKDYGTIYAVSRSGVERVVHNFQGPPNDGAEPFAGLTAAGGKLYGTTRFGGSGTKCPPLGCGTVFEAETSGSERVVYSFEGGTDGFAPVANVVAFRGKLYGTTYSGGYLGCSGGVGCGTLFKLSRQGVKSVLYLFGGKRKPGAFPMAGLTALDGTLYGTTYGGGVKHDGTVFELGSTSPTPPDRP
jgi:uncharacterized repeat protein (TIGR03803 family)